MRRFYDLLKEVLKGYEADEDTPSVQFRSFRRFTKNKQKNVNNKDLTPVLRVIDNLQQPDENYASTGMIGELGLSSIKTINSILDERVSSIVTPIDSVESRIFILADADSNSGYNFIKDNKLDIFGKINLGLGKLRTKDGNRDIVNFGILLGADINLLKDNLRTGISIMYDKNKLSGEYRKSSISSLIFSLYSKYDILKLDNSDVFYTYGILSYSHTNENSEYGFVLNFDNNSSKASANIGSIDVVGGYKFNNFGIIPELGFGFIYGSQNSYKDNLGQKISSRSSSILSIKGNIRYEIPSKYLFDELSVFLKFGSSYNIFYFGDKGFYVLAPNGFEYYVKNAVEMYKFSFNFGFNIAYNINIKSKISFNYEFYRSSNLTNNKFSLEYRYSIR